MTILTGSWYCHAQQQLQQNNNKTRGQTIRIYTNNNTVNDSKKLLPPSSTATTTANNDRNNVNTNKWVNNTTSNLILPSIDEESNEFEECDNAYAAQQDVKEKFSVLNSDQWKKGTILIFGDSMLLGLREAKLCRRKRSKGHYFPGEKTEHLQCHQIPYRKEKLDNIFIHIGSNSSPCKTEDLIY